MGIKNVYICNCFYCLPACLSPLEFTSPFDRLIDDDNLHLPEILTLQLTFELDIRCVFSINYIL